MSDPGGVTISVICPYCGNATGGGKIDLDRTKPRVRHTCGCGAFMRSPPGFYEETGKPNYEEGKAHEPRKPRDGRNPFDLSDW